MLLHCDRHHVVLRRVLRGGRIEWEGPYSHHPRIERRHQIFCRRCRKERVAVAGRLCYICAYYRS